MSLTLQRLTIEEYHDLIASGGLSEQTRLELIDGLMVNMRPRSPQHENAAGWLVDWLIDHGRRPLLDRGVATPLAALRHGGTSSPALALEFPDCTASA